MDALLRTFGLWLLLGFLVAGCSTPSKRARVHAEAFHRLSPSDQALVLHGHVRPGLSQDDVYIAWGEPDRKTAGGVGKDAAETWVYRQRVTLYNPMSFYDHFGPYHGYGDWPREPWLRPGYGIGGIGNEGLLEYRPNVRSLDTLRIAEFSGGKVDRYKDLHGVWSQAPPKVSKHAPVARPQAVHHAARKHAQHAAKASVKAGKTGKHSPKKVGKTSPKGAKTQAKRTGQHAKGAQANRAHGSRSASGARRL